MTMSVVINTIFKDISIISPLSASMVKETRIPGRMKNPAIFIELGLTFIHILNSH